MTNWQTTKLDNLCLNITDGEHASVIDDPAGKYFLLSNKNIVNGQIKYDNTDRVISEETFRKINKRTKLEAGDIVFSTVGILGKSAIVQGEIQFDFQRSVGVIKTDPKLLNNKYLYYYLNTKFVRKRVNDLSKGAVQKCFFISDLKDLDIHLPSNFSTQKEIAAVLSALDDKIELNNKINMELEQMAKTLYDYWFVQFDFPNKEGKPYKSSGGEMVYDAVLKREIPKGWEVMKLSEIAQTGSGGTPKSTTKEYYENGNIPWINSGELNSPFIISTKNFITEVAMKNSSAKYFPANTILMAMYGATAGKTSIISFEATTNQAICAVMPKEKEFFHYTKFVLDDMYQYLINLSTGSARDNLSQDKIKNLDVIIPDSESLKKYSKQVATSFEKIKNNLQQNQELASLRDWLLPMLMNGQVKVGESDGEVLGLVAESSMLYNRSDEKTPAWYDQRFELWISQQGLAARGNIDKSTLRELFDAMNDEDK